MNERSTRIPRNADYTLTVSDDGARLVVSARTSDGSLAGHARAIRSILSPGEAEAKLTIADAAAHPLLEAKLLDALRSEARSTGIERLNGRVVFGDTATQRLLIARGAACWIDDSGTIAFELPVSRRTRTVPPEVAQRRQLGRLRMAS